MARILGVILPDRKELFVALTKIYGIGFATAEKIIQYWALDKVLPYSKLSKSEAEKFDTLKRRRIYTLTAEELASLSQAIVKLQSTQEEGHPEKILRERLLLEGDLRKKVSDDLTNLKEIASYVGLRHRRNLPVHGQRTRTNARTRKGPRKTVANKKIEGKK
ncbi:30S ribosomal protein S13 [Candidatus Mycoplasma haematolamae str. Purdue]|uniref:Small ribosomal subunit protein uS13 n=1 Tax=Mycoplasma haematolamae (strain Purdue) TaxID=1212765 RepID=I7CJR1_MYCHA|nr:30S ribosomal protein S13 [Candidatus Mycoplasma haematolamae]AFO52099.1 30S ribosomal protein S13 [Candidatus Mycoplasma haematolamae str. Purdue]